MQHLPENGADSGRAAVWFGTGRISHFARRISGDNRAATDLAVLLDRWEQGDRAALDDMLPSIYAELKQLARIYLRRERADHTHGSRRRWYTRRTSS